MNFKSFLFFYKFYVKRNLNKKRFSKVFTEIKLKPKKKDKVKLANSDRLNISKNVVSDILNKLEAFEQKKGFKENGLTLNDFSKKINTNSSYLSKVINYYKGQSFSSYLNSMRIDYAINELKNNEKFRNYTIVAIAEEVGFNNSESFSKAFFRKSGLYPSFFIKNLNKENKG